MFVKSYIRTRNLLLETYERTDTRAVPTIEQVKKAVHSMEMSNASHVVTLRYITDGIQENLLFMQRWM